MAGKRGSFAADLDQLRTMFASVDPQNTSCIGYKELQVLVESNAGIDEDMISLIQEKLDRDRDGKISFEDFQELFELERDTIKRQKLGTSPSLGRKDIDEGKAGPVNVGEMGKPGKLTLDLRQSPVQLRRPPTDTKSPAGHDLATQMSHLTRVPESPKINRASKVLSWISESDDMYEGTGISEEKTDGYLSPPMSPKRIARAEEDNVCTIIKEVCQAEHIGPEAIRKLCAHVDTDDQEQQMLLTLLADLDTDGKGHVSVEEFVGGLQYLVAPASEEIHPKHLTVSLTRFMEPLNTTPSSQRTTSYQTSTPLTSQRKTIKGASSELTILDPNNSGYVGVDTLAQQWQSMGVEVPHNTKLEDTLNESLVIDASRRVSVSDVATTLESAVMNDSQNSTLRHAALLTFKGEINKLRNLLHQVSMERDGLASSLQRTMEESKRMVMEGDEQVEKITKESERKAWENEQRLSERLREAEREKFEEAKRYQELIDIQKEKYEREVEEMKYREDELKKELKLASSEANKRDLWDREEREVGRSGDRSDKFEDENDETDGIINRLQELEQENASLIEQSKILQELNRNLQDRIDELMADNEKVKQKYTSHKRKLQRAISLQQPPQPTEGRKRPQSAKRSSSANRRLTPLEIMAEPLYSEKSEELEVDQDIASEESNVASSDDGHYGQSTTSLLDELQHEDAKNLLERKLEELRREKLELEDNYYLLEEELQKQHDKSDFEINKLIRKKKELQKQIQSLEEQRRKLSTTKDGIKYQLETMESHLVRQLADIHKLQQKLSGAEVDIFGSNSSRPQDADKKLGSEIKLISSQYEKKISEIEQELQALSAEKESLMCSYKEEVDKIKLEASAKEEEIHHKYNTTILGLQRKCDACCEEAEQYKHDIEGLESQVSMLRNRLRVKEREVNQSQEKHQRKVLPILPVQAADKKEIMQLKEERENLVIEVNKLAEEVKRIQEICHHQQQQHEANIQQQEELCKKELEKARNDYENKIASVQVASSQENTSSKLIRDESAEQDLKVCRLTIGKLEGRVEAAEMQCESLMEQLSRQRSEAKRMEKEMSELKNVHAKAQKEISVIERERERIQTQLTKCEQALQSNLQKQNENVVFEETILSSMPEDQLTSTPFFSTTPQSDNSNHEIVSQMKQQLEDLQACLVQQNASPSKKNESTLIQELLAMNNVLKEELERELMFKLHQSRRNKEEAVIQSSSENNQIQAIEETQEMLDLLQQNYEVHIASLEDRIQAMSNIVNELTEKVKQRMHHSHFNVESIIGNGVRLKFDDADQDVEGDKEMLTREISALKKKLHNRELEINELQNKLRTIVREPVEVVHYMETTPQFSVNDAFFTSVQRDSAETEQHKDGEMSTGLVVPVHMTQQEAAGHVDTSIDSKIKKERGTKLSLLSPGREETDYGDVARQAQDEIARLHRQLLEERNVRLEAERKLQKNLSEWQLQETEWLVEHEEEVRALKQRNEQLSQALQDTHDQYQNFFKEQQQESSEMVQDLIVKQANLENELEERTKHMNQGSIPSDGLTEEKTVLLNIIEELCTHCFTDGI